MLVFAQKTHIRGAKTAFLRLFSRHCQGSQAPALGSLFDGIFAYKNDPENACLRVLFCSVFSFFQLKKTRVLNPQKANGSVPSTPPFTVQKSAKRLWENDENRLHHISCVKIAFLVKIT